MRDTYNTKLTAAEKLQKDTLDKDMFRKMTPTAEDLKVLNAVPTRPNNPDVPAAYAGPITQAVGLASPNFKNTILEDTTSAAGAWGKYMFSDIPFADWL